MSETEIIEVEVVETKTGKAFATKNHGWPSNNPTFKGHKQWLEVMGEIEDAINIDACPIGLIVAEIVVDEDDRTVEGWKHVDLGVE